jgi:putative transposase
MRKPRRLKAGASYHVIGRVNRQEFIFNSPEIKRLLIATIREAKKKYSFEINNFCIMGNHVHLLIKPLHNENLSRIMQWILGRFAVSYNKLRGCTGHLWHDRFKSKIIGSFYQYLKTFAYIANNPVRAEITDRALNYQYNGISYIEKGIFDILERPPNQFLKLVWPMIL